MNQNRTSKTAYIVLFVHGFVEVVVGGISLSLLPAWLVSIFWPLNLIFALQLCCLIFGIPRLIAGYAIMTHKKWGNVFGIILSAATIIASPILVFYIIKPPLAGTISALALDIPLALVVLISLLRAPTANDVSQHA